jgi:large repetitive protein
MAKQYKVLVNTGKAENNSVIDVPRNATGKDPVRIKAKAGAKYQLQELNEQSGNKPLGPDYVKTKRVGKNLHILFEGDKEASVIIEDYYDVSTEGYNGLIGEAENGSFYEYIPEDPQIDGLVPSLRDGGNAVNAALGGNEVNPAGAAVAALAIGPLAGLLGVGAAAAAVAGGGAGGTTGTATTGALTAVDRGGLERRCIGQQRQAELG